MKNMKRNIVSLIKTPKIICWECGNQYGTKFEGIKQTRKGTCEVCKEKKMVLNGKHYEPYIKEIVYKNE